MPATVREPESVGARVRRLRVERGLSQRDLSEPGVSYAYVSRIEAGARQPSLKAIRILARKLGVSPEYLETGAGTPKVYDRELRLADAELAVRLGDEVDRPERALRALVAEAREASDVAAETRARIALGLALARNGRHPDAIAQLERIEESPAVTPASRPELYATLGQSYAAVGEIRRAVSLFERALAELAEAAPDDTTLERRFRSQLSAALAEAGDIQRARAVLLPADEEASSRPDVRRRVERYRTLGRDASRAGEPVAAMTYLRRALGILDASEDALELARAHLHAAEVLLLEDQAEQAGLHLERAERLLELGADPRDMAALRTQQAHRAVRLGQSGEAVERATEALSNLGDRPPEQGSAWHALGAAQALKGDVEAASESLGRAVELLREAGEWREAMSAYRVWAQILRRAGRNQEAFEVIEQATLLTLRHAGTSARRAPTNR